MKKFAVILVIILVIGAVAISGCAQQINPQTDDQNENLNSNDSNEDSEQYENNEVDGQNDQK